MLARSPSLEEFQFKGSLSYVEKEEKGKKGKGEWKRVEERRENLVLVLWLQ